MGEYSDQTGVRLACRHPKAHLLVATLLLLLLVGDCESVFAASVAFEGFLGTEDVQGSRRSPAGVPYSHLSIRRQDSSVDRQIDSV